MLRRINSTSERKCMCNMTLKYGWKTWLYIALSFRSLSLALARLASPSKRYDHTRVLKPRWKCEIHSGRWTFFLDALWKLREKVLSFIHKKNVCVLINHFGFHTNEQPTCIRWNLIFRPPNMTDREPFSSKTTNLSASNVIWATHTHQLCSHQSLWLPSVNSLLQQPVLWKENFTIKKIIERWTWN